LPATSRGSSVGLVLGLLLVDLVHVL